MNQAEKRRPIEVAVDLDAAMAILAHRSPVGYSPTTNWEQCGPLITEHKIALYFDELSAYSGARGWVAGFNIRSDIESNYESQGPIAALELDYAVRADDPRVAVCKAIIRKNNYPGLPHGWTE